MEPTGRHGTVTMADVAAAAGVSRALVSIVFRDVAGASAATRERVLRAADELGYRPDRRASLLGSNRSRTVGVVFGLHHEFHGQLVERLYAAAAGSGYDLVLGAAAPTRPEPTAVSGLLGLRCESLILVGPELSRSQIEDLARRVPVVVIARPLPGATVDVVRTDDTAGAQLAVRHLLDLGHRDVAHVDGGRAPGAAERRRGYRRAMREAGLGDRTRLVTGGLTERDGELAVRALLDPPAPSAVLAFNDHCAAGVVAALRARGLAVPGGVSVVGFDDSRIAALSTLSLTTVAQDVDALAEHALSRALARADGDTSAAVEVVVPPRLVVRHTTAGQGVPSERLRAPSPGG